jgi:membrane protein DedA with SNARE-associated domain
MGFDIVFHQLEHLFAHYGYLLIFLGTLIETTPFGWLVPGALLASLGGFYAFMGPLRLSAVIFCAFSGMFITLLSSYLIGYKTGMTLAKKMHQEKNAHTAKILLQKHGAVILTTALLANLTRFWIAYIAGMQKYNVYKFMLYAAIASLTWVSVLVIIGYVAGTGRHTIETGLAQAGIFSWIFVVGGFLYWRLKDELKEAGEDFEKTHLKEEIPSSK